MNIRKLLPLAALAAIASVARADELTLAGSATGTFASTSSNSLFGGLLTYTGSTFNVTTILNGYSLGNTDTTGALTNNLGLFTLQQTSNLTVFNGQTFNLLVSFTAPTGIDGAAFGTYSGVLTGAVRATDSSLSIDFGGSKSWTFANADGTGSFSLRVNPTSIQYTSPNSPAQVVVTGAGTGEISSVPGPGALAAFGTGLIGMARRRRRN